MDTKNFVADDLGQKRYLISYREEFSTVIEADNPAEAMSKVEKSPAAYQWECIGNLWADYLKHETDHLSESQLALLGYE